MRKWRWTCVRQRHFADNRSTFQQTASDRIPQFGYALVAAAAAEAAAAVEAAAVATGGKLQEIVSWAAWERCWWSTGRSFHLFAIRWWWRQGGWFACKQRRLHSTRKVSFHWRYAHSTFPIQCVPTVPDWIYLPRICVSYNLRSKITSWFKQLGRTSMDH